jgi:hypothetical protein
MKTPGKPPESRAKGEESDDKQTPMERFKRVAARATSVSREEVEKLEQAEKKRRRKPK